MKCEVSLWGDDIVYIRRYRVMFGSHLGKLWCRILAAHQNPWSPPLLSTQLDSMSQPSLQLGVTRCLSPGQQDVRRLSSLFTPDHENLSRCSSMNWMEMKKTALEVMWKWQGLSAYFLELQNLGHDFHSTEMTDLGHCMRKERRKKQLPVHLSHYTFHFLSVRLI